MEREPVKSIEQDSNVPFDAILIHGYWMSEHRKGDVRLALRSRLAVRAGALTYNAGKGAKRIVIDQGHMWGSNYPTQGQLMKDELVNKYGISTEAIILKEDAYSTGGEVKSFVEQARQHGWKKLLDVAFSNHHLTIPKIYEEYKNEAKVEYQSVEAILTEKDNHLVIDLAKRLGESRHGIAYKAYERVKWFRMHMPRFSYELFEQKNKRARTSKGQDFIFPIDVYKL